MITDFLLIQKMKQGNEQAFDTFVRKYYNEILKYCSYHCFDTQYAEGSYSFLQSRDILCAEGIGDCKCFICDFNYSGIVEKQIQSMYGDRKRFLLFS